MDLTFRKLTRRDLETVMTIESSSHPNAWPRKVFWNYLKSPMTRAVMLEVDKAPRAFTIASVEGLSCHLLNIAVAPEWRRKGLATAAIDDLENYARQKTLVEIYFEVRESNLPAQMLYKKLGYSAVDILRGHYGNDDGYRMRKPIFSAE